MRTFLSSRRGSILIEAAIAFPVLIAILLGMAEFGEAYTARRKNEQVANTVADLVSQVSSITTAQLTDIANIRTTILQPYSATPSGLRISSVVQNASNATVQWSFAIGNLTATKTGATYSLPTGLITQTQTIIVAESTYTFTPTVGSYLAGGVTFDAVAYYTPRLGSVTCC